jgi:hypothetical protein
MEFNMLNSDATIRAAQSSRALSLPEQLDAPSPAREALLEGFRQRNALLDYLFYDIGCVRPEEARRIAPHWAAEGAILLVPPSGAGDIVLCTSVEGFLAGGGGDVSALAVAGVGSSALGSAAFARNVADAIGAPVAAVVSGYGLADLATEALGGFFWFGALNQLRHSFERLDELTKPSFIKRPDIDGGYFARCSRDTQAVLSLLSDERLSFDLLCGHSKGNLVISEALFELQQHDPERTRKLSTAVTIVTVSALIAMPRPYATVIDVMGGWDWFGGLNSRAGIPLDVKIPGAWHHTNTELPAHLPVTAALRSVLSR